MFCPHWMLIPLHLVSRHIPGKQLTLFLETIPLTFLLITHRPNQHQPQSKPCFTKLSSPSNPTGHRSPRQISSGILYLAPSTSRTYNSAKTWFITFCLSWYQSPGPILAAKTGPSRTKFGNQNQSGRPLLAAESSPPDQFRLLRMGFPILIAEKAE